MVTCTESTAVPPGVVTVTVTRALADLGGLNVILMLLEKWPELSAGPSVVFWYSTFFPLVT
jgi:hypothetical protein